MSRKIDRTGERFVSKEELGGYEFVIIKYDNANKLLIQFQDEYKDIVPSTYQHCKDGSVVNNYHPSVYGLGFLGSGEYKSRDENGNKTKCYRSWYNIFIRCCDEKRLKKFPTYRDCFINEELYNFQNFAKWFDENYYEIEGERMCLDKDILVKGNKEYRFDRMIFVPERINTLFIKSDAVRGKYPIGVSYHKASGKYATSILKHNKDEWLGLYNTPNEAFIAYKEAKEAYIKQVADEYKGRIPDRLYEAMYKWRVEKDD